MKVRVCSKCGILWSKVSRLMKKLECPNCGYEGSKEVDLRE